MQALLEEHLPGVGPQQRKWILDATAVAAYHAEAELPVVRLLVCDDAPQFTLVTEELALCWVHEGRHYTKLLPSILYHQSLLEAIEGDIIRIWSPGALYCSWLDARVLRDAHGAITGLLANGNRVKNLLFPRLAD